MPANKLPPFVSDTGSGFDNLDMAPPFYFQGMTARVFPLRARAAVLQNLVDNQLNIMPPEMGRFRVVAPFVMMMMLDYGKLAVQAANLGWLAQHEITFHVPLAWWVKKGDEWEFKEFCWVAPFIFVDSEIALDLGRKVYGWPKLLATQTPRNSEWMEDPRSPDVTAAFSTKVFPSFYDGAKQVDRVFLEVFKETVALPPITLGRPTGDASMSAPWQLTTRMAQSVFGLTRDFIAMMSAFGLTRRDNSVPNSPEQIIQHIASNLLNPASNIGYNTLNLKQFRDTSSPTHACYQSLTNARMVVKAFNEGGMLGDLNMMVGDATGGFTIRLAHWPSLPIVSTLGLETTRTWEGPECKYSELSPVLPFWYDVDMSWERGKNLGWRTLDGKWRIEDTPIRPVSDNHETESRFNTTVGALQTLAGPFVFSNTTLRVLPLAADAKTLQQFLDNYLNEPLASRTGPMPMRFEVWTDAQGDGALAYVYWVISSFDKVISLSNDVGNWANREAATYIPVRWMCRQSHATAMAQDPDAPAPAEGADDPWVLGGVGLVPISTYMDNAVAMISNSEVLGINTLCAEFVDTPRAWDADATPDLEHTLLTIRAEVLPALDVGQKAEERALIEVCTGELAQSSDKERRYRKRSKWRDAFAGETVRMKHLANNDARSAELGSAMALGLELLTRRREINLFTLKQFRHVEYPDRACFQSLQLIKRRIEHVFDIQEIDTPVHLRIHDYASQQLVKKLGLLTTFAFKQDGGLVYDVVPLRPFMMRTTYLQELGQRLAYRVNTDAWNEITLPESALLGPRSDGIAYSNQMQVEIDDTDPARLEHLVQTLCANEQALGTTRENARMLVDKFAPQTVLSAMLSREWGHAGTDSRWRKATKHLTAELKRRLEGVVPGRQNAIEDAFYAAAIREHLDKNAREYLGFECQDQMKLVALLREISAQTDRAFDPESASIARFATLQARLDELPAMAKSGAVTESVQRRCYEIEWRFRRAGDEISTSRPWEGTKGDMDDRVRAAGIETIRSVLQEERERMLWMLGKGAQKADFLAPEWLEG
jgi:hypothetical protein